MWPIFPTNIYPCQRINAYAYHGHHQTRREQSGHIRSLTSWKTKGRVSLPSLLIFGGVTIDAKQYIDLIRVCVCIFVLTGVQKITLIQGEIIQSTNHSPWRVCFLWELGEGGTIWFFFFFFLLTNKHRPLSLGDKIRPPLTSYCKKNLYETNI